MTSIKTVENQTLALAGINQAVYLCKQLATTGSCDQEDMTATLRSILTLTTDRVIDPYAGSARNIQRGLRVLKNQLAGNAESRDLDIARYALALIQLGTNIEHDQKTVEQLRIGISRAQSLEFDVTDPTMINNFANLYRSSISHLSPRIMVSGDPDYLNDTTIASTIRAALLGGLRSVVLWRQCGGTRPKLLFQRGQHVKAAEEFLMQ
jgi:high frequency lysogenization protein